MSDLEDLVDTLGSILRCRPGEDVVSAAKRVAAEVERLYAEVEWLRFDRDLVHGFEAERLRRGVERIIAEGATSAGLQGLLDEIDARDSLAHLEERAQLVDGAVADEREGIATMLDQNGLGAAARLVRYRGEEATVAE